MGNGGWYGTYEEWNRAEAPLLKIDDEFEKFALSLGYPVKRNDKDNPSRSIEWVKGIRCLIQLYQVDQETLTFNLWICASQDLLGKRAWKQETLIKSKRVDEFMPNLKVLLTEGAEKLSVWSENPGQLEYITDIG